MRTVRERRAGVAGGGAGLGAVRERLSGEQRGRLPQEFADDVRRMTGRGTLQDDNLIPSLWHRQIGHQRNYPDLGRKYRNRLFFCTKTVGRWRFSDSTGSPRDRSVLTSGSPVHPILRLCQNRVREDEHGDEALRPSLPDSGARRGRMHAPVLPVPGVRRTGPVETTSRHVGEETSREGLHDGCEAQSGKERVPMQSAVVGVDEQVWL
jgi:hypothetical protein